MGFVNCYDIAVFCFILNQSGQLRIKEKLTIYFTGLNVFFKLLTGLSEFEIVLFHNEVCGQNWVAINNPWSQKTRSFNYFTLTNKMWEKNEDVWI